VGRRGVDGVPGDGVPVQRLKLDELSPLGHALDRRGLSGQHGAAPRIRVGWLLELHREAFRDRFLDDAHRSDHDFCFRRVSRTCR
jgi:hypothetical protein